MKGSIHYRKDRGYYYVAWLCKGKRHKIYKYHGEFIYHKKIAEKLFISIRTVETHRRNIFTKTNTKNVVGLIKYAMKQGLTQNETA